jgi:hypothetical protein
MNAHGWGAHAARVLVSAASPKQSFYHGFKGSSCEKEKFAMASRHRQHASRVRSPEPLPHTLS